MSSPHPPADNGRLSLRLLAIGRAAEWWEYKFVPALAAGYATALHLGATPWSALSGLTWLLIALLPGGVFVSVLNDLTDRRDDAAAGKANRQVGLGTAIPVAIILVCLGLGGWIAWLWRGEPAVLVTYGIAWLAFAFYSLPPIRLKRRGFYGVLCDATGANVVPALLAAQFSANALGRPVEWSWLVPVAIWSLMFGLRGILSHQIGDVASDHRAGTATFVARTGPERAKWLASRVVFPLEMIGLALIVGQTGTAGLIAALVGLGLYILLLHERIDRFLMKVTLVSPEPRSCLLMHDYYDVFLPFGLLIAGIVLEPKALVVLALHCVLFPIRIRQVLTDFVKLTDRQYERRPRP